MTPSRLFRCTAALVLALVLTACAGPALRVTGIPIAKGATFDLLAPAALGQAVSLEQIVEAKYGEREFTFHCLLEVDAEHLVLVGMTPFNTRAFTLTLKDQELSIEIVPGAQLPAEPSRILADLQLALWPAPRVHGLKTGDHGSINSQVREFSRGSNVVIQIVYDFNSGRIPLLKQWETNLVFRHLEQNYTLTVRTVHAETLKP